MKRAPQLALKSNRQRSNLVSLLLICILASIKLPAGAQPALPARATPPKQGWTLRAQLTGGAVFAATVAGPDGRVYVITGSTESGRLTARNSAYDPRQDTWNALAPIPTPRSEPGAALGADGKIYVIGGNPTLNRNQSSRMNAVEAYDPKTDRWNNCKSLPVPRTALCAVAASDAGGRQLLFAIGGRNFDLPGNGLNTVEAYDPRTDSWSTKSNMPLNLHGMTATLGPDGKIYVLGGTNSKLTDINQVQVYDPAADRWNYCINMPYGQECACSTFIPGDSGEIFVFGGWGDLNKISLSSAVAFNPQTQLWRWLPQLLSPTAGAGAVRVKAPDGTYSIYVIGGIPNSSCVQELSLAPTGP
jgi:N-acetylneuraminic acid mutarotase